VTNSSRHLDKTPALTRRRVLAASLVGALGATIARFAVPGRAKGAALWDIRSGTDGQVIRSWHDSPWTNSAIDVDNSWGQDQWCGVFPAKAYTGEAGIWWISSTPQSCDSDINPNQRAQRYNVHDQYWNWFGEYHMSHIEPWYGNGNYGMAGFTATIGDGTNTRAGCYTGSHLHQASPLNHVDTPSPGDWSYVNATVYWNAWL